MAKKGCPSGKQLYEGPKGGVFYKTAGGRHVYCTGAEGYSAEKVERKKRVGKPTGPRTTAPTCKSGKLCGMTCIPADKQCRGKVGSRKDVYNGLAQRTRGGLTKEDIMFKNGRYISKARHEQGRAQFQKNAANPEWKAKWDANKKKKGEQPEGRPKRTRKAPKRLIAE